MSESAMQLAKIVGLGEVQTSVLIKETSNENFRAFFYQNV